VTVFRVRKNKVSKEKFLHGHGQRARTMVFIL